jgi:hypothetical protein
MISAAPQAFPLFLKKVFFVVDDGGGDSYTPHPNAVPSTGGDIEKCE